MELSFFREHNYSHSYAVYKKLTTSQIGPSDLQTTSFKTRDTKIKEIYESSHNQHNVIKKLNIDGLIYSLKYLDYENFKLIFMEDDFSTTLVNFIPLRTENFPRNEEICTWEVPSTWIHTIDPFGFAFKAINTWKPFVEFNDDFHRGIKNSNKNNDFWSDVDDYLDGKPSKGIYEYVQLGSLIIVYSYKKSNDKYNRINKSHSPYSTIVDNYMDYKSNL